MGLLAGVEKKVMSGERGRERQEETDFYTAVLAERFERGNRENETSTGESSRV